ncbi:pyrroline-5-carboxylate reductase family protein [Pontiella sp.]|uniref:pyrroline-5-carboxylate reductase family protein n=1 Tax=Pontiella sp. TaxID=2837462 RepID=UPI0035626877
MKIESIGFVGGGRAARIILHGWKKAGTIPSRVVVADPNPEVLEALAKLVPGIETTGDNTAAAAQDVCMLSVHPPLAKDVVPALAPALKREGQVLVSLLPKVTMDKLSGMLGGFGRIARMIPNAPSFIGEGYNPIAFAQALSDADRQALGELFASLGETPAVDEATLEAYAIVTAMGPTYFWPQLEHLRTLAESFGLSPEAAMRGIEQMMSGAVGLMKDGGLSPEQVQDLIPVKPLADDVEALCGAMDAKLAGLMEKLRP